MQKLLAPSGVVLQSWPRLEYTTVSNSLAGDEEGAQMAMTKMEA